MKVTTDACIQGAWTPVSGQVKNILDIGTGTGLLALMLAQKNPDIIIDAIELDTDAAAQARENAAGSPWANRINIIEGDIKAYRPEHKYDLVISNPPFFNNSLLSPKDAKNAARHTTSLSYEDLFGAIEENLAADGVASILLPCPEAELWEKLVASKGWHIASSLSVKHRDNALVKRMIYIISRNAPKAGASQILVIQNHDGTYTEMFAKLLAPYYLHL